MRTTDEVSPLWWRAFRVFGFCSGMMIAVLVVGIWAHPLAAKVTPGSPVVTEGDLQNVQKDVAKLTQDVQAQSTMFAAQKEELDYLTRIAELMMTVVGIYTIILGAVSWKTLDSQKEEFEQASKGSLAKFERIRDELQLDFPMLGRIQNNFMIVLASLRAACQSLDVKDDSYESLSQTEVQKILFYENAITTAVLLNAKGYEKELSEIYRLLGVFYGSRFYSTLPGNKFDESTHSDYFYRAQFYFDRAIELDPGNYTLYMHAGYFSQYYDNRVVANLSKRYFENASQVGTQFQKPLASIALIELEAFKDPVATLAVLKSARTRKQYDSDTNFPRPEYISYLEACALCLKAQKESGPERFSTLQEAMARLSDAAKKPNEEWQRIRGFFDDDRMKYFSILEGEPELGQESASYIQEIRASVFGG